MDIAKFVEYGVMIYGIMSLVVKTFPTIPAKYPILVNIMKLLGNIANRQTNDDAVRKA